MTERDRDEAGTREEDRNLYSGRMTESEMSVLDWGHCYLHALSALC